MNAIQRKKFKELDLTNQFFDSLKADYPGFEKWFLKKAENGRYAYVLEDNGLQGFLYLKEEKEEDTSITPLFELKRRLKVGTFKVNAHGTRVGDRFIKLIIDEMYRKKYKEAYVTIFGKHSALIDLFERYGFYYYGKKNSISGVENVYIKNANRIFNDIYLDYPKIHIKDNNKFLLSIYPKFHTRMFPDSKLRTEKDLFIEDVSSSNSIEKIYLSGAYHLDRYKKGDIAVIYRTSNNGPAWYESVATSVCIVEEIRHIRDFNTWGGFRDYCIKYSVFEEAELKSFWNSKKYPHLIKMLYNVAFKKRPIRKQLVEYVGLNQGDRWVAVPLTDNQFKRILELGEINESLIIN